MIDSKTNVAKIEKEKEYYNLLRSDLIDILPKDHHYKRVLDVGCGTGVTCVSLKEKYNVQFLAGIEVNPAAAEIAKSKLDTVYCSSVEDVELDEIEPFDLILFADVLEHLYDPWTVMRRFTQYLTEDGHILCSIPNVQHFSILLKLFIGNWRYKSAGLLDSTHIRFFTRKTILEMVAQANLNISKLHKCMGIELKIVNYLTLGLFSDILSYRYYILANKNHNVE
jgi:2-polyprenyl-3-methyl-5-hydroxy-6-metoxy-1,4-benzoquinol methylase